MISSILGLAMMAVSFITGVSLVNDVKIFGIKESVTIYLGAEVPVWATVNAEATNQQIEWVLNFPELMKISANGNQAILKPISEGGVNIMARAMDGSDSSRSIYALLRNYDVTVSNFLVSPGIKPIMEFGNNEKIFQVEVDSSLDSSNQIFSLKQYLNLIHDHGEIKIENKELLTNDYTLYSLKIANYLDITIQIRLDRRDLNMYNQLVSVIENESYQEEDQIVPPEENQTTEDQIVPPEENQTTEDQIVPPEENQTTEDQVVSPEENQTTEDQIVPSEENQTDIYDKVPPLTSNFNPNQVKPTFLPDTSKSEKEESLEDLLDSLDGDGSKQAPYQVSIDRILENQQLYGLIQNGFASGRTRLYRMVEGNSWWKYGLEILFEESGTANQFYIELVVGKNSEDEKSPLVEMILKHKNEMTIYAREHEVVEDIILSDDLSSLQVQEVLNKWGTMAEFFSQSPDKMIFYTRDNQLLKGKYGKINPTLLEIEKVLNGVNVTQDFSNRYFVAGIACSSLILCLFTLKRK